MNILKAFMLRDAALKIVGAKLEETEFIEIVEDCETMKRILANMYQILKLPHKAGDFRLIDENSCVIAIGDFTYKFNRKPTKN